MLMGIQLEIIYYTIIFVLNCVHQFHIQVSIGSHFAQILKMALLSISLNLEAQYCTLSWTKSGATYSQEIVDLVYIGLKL